MNIFKHKKAGIAIPFLAISLVVLLLLGFVLAGVTVIVIILKNYVIGMTATVLARLGIAGMSKARKRVKS